MCFFLHHVLKSLESSYRTKDFNTLQSVHNIIQKTKSDLATAFVANRMFRLMLLKFLSVIIIIQLKQLKFCHDKRNSIEILAKEVSGFNRTIRLSAEKANATVSNFWMYRSIQSILYNTKSLMLQPRFIEKAFFTIILNFKILDKAIF